MRSIFRVVGALVAAIVASTTTANAVTFEFDATADNVRTLDVPHGGLNLTVTSGGVGDNLSSARTPVAFVTQASDGLGVIGNNAAGDRGNGSINATGRAGAGTYANFLEFDFGEEVTLSGLVLTGLSDDGRERYGIRVDGSNIAGGRTLRTSLPDLFEAFTREQLTGQVFRIFTSTNPLGASTRSPSFRVRSISIVPLPSGLLMIASAFGIAGAASAGMRRRTA